MRTQKILLFTMMLFLGATPILASTKAYSLENLREVVSNHKKCASVFQDLQELNKKPIVFRFSQKAEGGFTAVHEGGKIKNHTHTSVKQKADATFVRRTVLGSFELNQEKIEYVMEVTGNIANKDHQYLYPAILSAEGGQCYFTALVKPDEATVAAFKSSIKSGDAAKGMDLTKK